MRKALTSLILFIVCAFCADARSLNPDSLMNWLYANMPLPDSVDRSRHYYMTCVIEPALQARQEMPWGEKVPLREFMHFVLPVRVNNEALDCHRPIFFRELKERVKNLSMYDAILETNHWCHEKLTYQPSDGRTHSPLQSVSSGIGRCGEESTFTVAALRSIGIPARQVYTPRWAHTDDNHAWVEAWADGKWYFLGACEPEPVLNLGWFNAPAARGMLMHARVFGKYSGGEEMLDTVGSTTIINVTANYAPVSPVTVTVRDSDGRPVEGADVTFRLYNYAEFYPIAERITDRAGKASLTAGHGDLLVWASHNGAYGFTKVSVGRDREAVVTLQPASGHYNLGLDLVPPPPAESAVSVTPEQRAANDARFAREDSIRKAYIGGFCSSPEWAKKARGNYPVLKHLLDSLSPREKRTVESMLFPVLPEKDLTDITPQIILDHITATNSGEIADTTFFARYVMSPRIALEELTPFRRQLRELMGEDFIANIRQHPSEWVNWVKSNISATENWYPEQATMSPVAVWKHRSTSPLSRDIFFVAGARAAGLPSRIDPVTGKVQWHDGKQWHDAILSQAAEPKASAAEQGSLRLLYTPEAHIADPKYFAHFTLSKIVDGQPQLLNFPDFAPWSETLADPYPLDAGTYLLVTGQRLADGGVLSRIKTIEILPGQTVVDTLIIRHDNSAIQVIGSFDAESKILSEGTECSILSKTGRGYYVVGLMKANHEPSNHILVDLASRAKELDAIGRPILLLYGSEDEVRRIDRTLLPSLPECVSIAVATDSTLKDLTEENKDYPVIKIADTFNRVVFDTHGYTIGIGDKLLDHLSRLQ